MQRKPVIVLSIVLLWLSPGLYAKKKAAPRAAAAAPRMPPDRKVLHALNRLTFGARPGDVEEVNRTGLDQWIERQLHPRSIPEDPGLEARLAPLDTLRM